VTQVMKAGERVALDVRDDFPALAQDVNGHPLVYLDSAASAQQPSAVIDAVADYQRHDHANRVDPDTQSGDEEALERITERELARQRMERALGDLPDEQRDVFLLYEEAGLNLEQIADVTGVNRETAKSRLRYAVRKLRKAIDESNRQALEAT